MDSKKKSYKKDLLGVPIVVWLGFLVGVPLIFVFVLSFLSRDALGNVVLEFTLENYKRMFDATYVKIFINSFVLAALTALVTLVIGYPVAYFTASLSAKRKGLVLLLIMLPFWISSLLRVYGWVILLGRTGVINNLLSILGMPAADMMYKFSTVLIGTAYMLIPFMIISLYNSVDKLDRSLLEASRDLGAGRVRTFVNITLPLTLSGIAGGVTLVFIPALGLFFVSDLLGGGQNVFLGNVINTLTTRGRNRPMAAAVSVIMIVLVIIVLLIYARVTKNKEAELF